MRSDYALTTDALTYSGAKFFAPPLGVCSEPGFGTTLIEPGSVVLPGVLEPGSVVLPGVLEPGSIVLPGAFKLLGVLGSVVLPGVVGAVWS